MAFYKVNRNKTKSRAAENDRRNAARGQFRYLQEGRTVFRVLPPWSKRAADEGLAYLRVGQHRIFEQYYLCAATSEHLRDTVGDCEICNVVAYMRERGAKKQSEAYSVRTQVAVPVVMRDKERGDQVTVLKAPGQLGDFIDQKLTEDDEYAVGDFTDPTLKGRDIVSTKKGKGLNTRYQFDFVDSAHAKAAVKDLKALVVPDLDKIFAWSAEMAEEIAAVAEKIKSRFEEQYSEGVENAGVGAEVVESDPDEVESVEAEDAEPEATDDEAEPEATDEDAEPEATDDEAEPDADETPSDEDLPSGEDPDEAEEGAEVEPPKIDPRTKKPVCFMQYVERNPEGPPSTDPQCAICTVEAICQHKSLRGETVAPSPVKKPAPAPAPVKKPAPAPAKPAPAPVKKPAPAPAPVKKPAPAPAPVKKPAPAPAKKPAAPPLRVVPKGKPR